MNLRTTRIAPAVALLATLLLAACPEDLTGPEGSPPAGKYTCHYYQYAQVVTAGHLISILSGGRYRAPDGGSGTYTYEAASQTVRWTSGPFADGSLRAQFFRADDGKPVIRVAPAAGGDDPRQTNSCALYRATLQ